MEYGMIISQQDWIDLNDKISNLIEVVNSYIPKKEDIIYNNKEVMDLLNICSRTLLSYRQKGKIKYSKIGGKLFYRKSEIDRILEENSKSRFNNY